jgi:hypothetical protein
MIKLELEEALAKETPETLTEWIQSKRAIALVEPNTIAQTEPIKEDRFAPKHGENYWYIDEFITVRKREYWNLTHDIMRFEANNCFKTEAEVNEIANKIKQLLNTL